MLATTGTPSVLARTQFYLTAFGALYVAVVGLLTVPFFQSKFVGFKLFGTTSGIELVLL